MVCYIYNENIQRTIQRHIQLILDLIRLLACKGVLWITTCTHILYTTELMEMAINRW
jgi:hypothetical protein